MIVHSNKNRSPRYFVTHGEKVVFQSESASDTLQWAINHAVDVGVDGVLELDSKIELKNNTVISGEKNK